jgi:PncC family amidohydrolase
MHQERPPTLVELAERVAMLAMARGISMAAAESCTGGLIAHLLTRVPGVSAVFPGSIVSYANEAKADLLRVPLDDLQRYGAVSEPVALAMARGARTIFAANLAVSTTGIAGPGGATLTKPVGLVYVAVASETGERCERYLFQGTRIQNIEAATAAALDLLYETLAGTTH